MDADEQGNGVSGRPETGGKILTAENGLREEKRTPRNTTKYMQECQNSTCRTASFTAATKGNQAKG